MPTHSSVLAWKIPWTEEPGGLQSMGSQSWIQLKRLSIPGSPVVKNSPTNARNTGDTGSIPGSGRSPGNYDISNSPPPHYCQTHSKLKSPALAGRFFTTQPPGEPKMSYTAGETQALMNYRAPKAS